MKIRMTCKGKDLVSEVDKLINTGGKIMATTGEAALNLTEVLRTLENIYPAMLDNILATIDLADDAYEESFKIIDGLYACGKEAK
tara:strand:- start:1173 stop:1427 length:255 start_codon:yes stop_codon:yes gene_type:complete